MFASVVTIFGGGNANWRTDRPGCSAFVCGKDMRERNPQAQEGEHNRLHARTPCAEHDRALQDRVPGERHGRSGAFLGNCVFLLGLRIDVVFDLAYTYHA